ncbi:MAG: thiosulfohydrolase SoxB [Rhodospirillales bacterium]|nr:thiosulfohydrolase SoxB [Rhodospirillales bacterium]
MEVTRRDFMALAAIAASSGLMPRATLAQAISPERLLDFESLGNVTLLHMTDSHATLLPVHYREPDTLLPVGDEAGKPPFVTGEAALKYYGFAKGSLDAHAFTHIDFAELARRYGKMGGYAHIATLVKRIRAERPGKVLFCDGGDTLQGSATSTWSEGRDMVDAINLLDVDLFSPHWEFTFGIDKVKEYFGDLEKRGLFKGEFLAHNVQDVIWKEPVFKPYAIRQVGGVAVGVIGQAFPYTPISHPRKFVPDLTFGIQEEQLQRYIDELRDEKKVDLVVLLSHNGFSVDIKLASRVKGLDVILGGHTHDAIPRALQVGKTLVLQSGAHSKYLSRLDLDVRDKKIQAHRFKLIPVLASHIPADPDMAALIQKIRAPHEKKLSEVLAVSESVLYRRGNFNGTFDEVVLDALLKHYDAEVAFSPGFRWGVSLVPGQPITYEDAFTHTALSYPNTWTRELTGAEIKTIMEDVADNLFNDDPYYRQGGDMVRVGGVGYTIDPKKKIGQRIADLTVGGKPMDLNKKYKATGWASVNDVDGPPAYDVVANYLRSVKRVKIAPVSRVKVV